MGDPSLSITGTGSSEGFGKREALGPAAVVLEIDFNRQKASDSRRPMGKQSFQEMSSSSGDHLPNPRHFRIPYRGHLRLSLKCSISLPQAACIRGPRF